MKSMSRKGYRLNRLSDLKLHGIGKESKRWKTKRKERDGKAEEWGEARDAERQGGEGKQEVGYSTKDDQRHHQGTTRRDNTF